MKMMFSAGEASGDLHGSRLAKEILKKEPDTKIFGFGGEMMRRAGVDVRFDIADYSVMGFWEVVKNIRRIFNLLDAMTELMRAESPDILVLIDYPDFNWRLAARAKKIGIKVLSYIPPSAWAWRKGRAKFCANLADEFISIFPFETKVYEEAGANISFVGNPLVDAVKSSMSECETRKFFGINEDDYPILLLPGSRKQEIELMCPVIMESAKKIFSIKNNAKFFLPAAQNINIEILKKYADESQVPVIFTREHTYELMGVSKFAVATSGTVILEAALMGLPSIVVYRLSPISYFIGRLFIHVKYFSLPNILMDERILPELLQDAANPDQILKEARLFWEEPGYMERVKSRLSKACSRLGSPGASGRAADKIIARAKM